ncbi:MAG: DUF3048 domain-containing protein [Patescibacteria group bacterium]
MNFLPNKKLQIVMAGILLYAVSTGVSYVAFSLFLKTPINIVTPFGNLSDPTSGNEEGTKDQPCPLNGVMYTKNRKDAWDNRRPLGVMVENHVDARPVLGLSRSDVVYEAIAESGITRYLAMYLCQDAGDIAPIRSARTYFIDWLSEYDAAYSHVGGANRAGPANALGQIRDYGIKDMDQFGIGFPTYWRGTDKLAPHNVHSTTKKLWEEAQERGFGVKDDKGVRWDANFTQWKFKVEAPLDQRSDQTPITVPFRPNAPDYAVIWKYDKESNTYKRFHGETAQIDKISNEQLSAKNIIIQLASERFLNDEEGHLLYTTTGSGKAIVFMDGKVTEGKWNKANRTARTKWTDAKGKEIELNRGQIWVQTIPIGNVVEY